MPFPQHELAIQRPGTIERKNVVLQRHINACYLDKKASRAVADQV
jgi:hypothetical protein